MHGELSADRKQAILKGGAYGARSTILLAALRRRRELVPSVKLVGGEKLEAALAEGRGVILWFDRLPMATVMGKRAFAEAGYRMWYLSGSRHGFSYSRFANRFLNWRMIDVELRYVAGRIVFDSASAVVATRKLKTILESNGIVGIANNAVMGKTINVPFAGGAAITIATAPLSLAVSCGACLLPVAVFEVEPFSSFEVIVGSEITVPDLPKRLQVPAMAENYASYALALAKAHPEIWDWSSLAKA
jgi:lauroyl/myristoyl acyltransferase